MTTPLRSSLVLASLAAVVTFSPTAQAAARGSETVTLELTEHGSRGRSSLSFVVVPGGSVSGWTTLGTERVHCRASVEPEDGEMVRVDLRCGPQAMRQDQTLKVEAIVSLKGKRAVVVGEVPGADGAKSVVTAKRN